MPDRGEGGLFAKGNKLAVGYGRHKIPQERINKISKDLIAWSKNPESFHIIEFTSKYNRAQNWLYDLEKNHPEIERSFRIARENLLLHYLKNGLTNKWNQSIVHRYLGFFDVKLSAFEDEKDQKKSSKNTKEMAELIVNSVNYAQKESTNESSSAYEEPRNTEDTAGK